MVEAGNLWFSQSLEGGFILNFKNGSAARLCLWGVLDVVVEPLLRGESKIDTSVRRGPSVSPASYRGLLCMGFSGPKGPLTTLFCPAQELQESIK